MLRLLVCHGDVEASGRGGLAVFLPDFRKVFAECRGVDAGGSDGLPSDLEGSCRDSVGVVLGHVGFEFVLDGFDFGVEVVGHLAEFGQFVELADDFVGCHLGFFLLCVEVFSLNLVAILYHENRYLSTDIRDFILDI